MGTGSDTLTWVRVVDLDDLWEGELIGAEVGDEELIVVHLEGGHIGAFLAACPHQGTSLATGYLEGETLVCQAHLWEFDARTGAGINPSTSCLVARPVRVEDDAVWIGQADSNVAASAEKGNEADGD
jgi:toluene monooxygenase system ferredoxin subunit